MIDVGYVCLVRILDQHRRKRSNRCHCSKNFTSKGKGIFALLTFLLPSKLFGISKIGHAFCKCLSDMSASLILFCIENLWIEEFSLLNDAYVHECAIYFMKGVLRGIYSALIQSAFNSREILLFSNIKLCDRSLLVLNVVAGRRSTEDLVSSKRTSLRGKEVLCGLQ